MFGFDVMLRPIPEMKKFPMRTAFITGTAGFIGFNLAKDLLAHGFKIVGYDGFTDYYDVKMKRARHAELQASSNHFHPVEGMLEDVDALSAAYHDANPDIVVHLAAQAGVRYSLENPQSYVSSNIIGTFNLMELTRQSKPDHFLFSSSSSVYGGNEDVPFTEMQRCDSPMSIYAATKKATEEMTHAYAHLHHIPTTGFRFFTVYGPWIRPDLALTKFTKAILAGDPIDIYNNGDMERDFTHVSDIVRGIRLLIDVPPKMPDERDGDAVLEIDTLSRVAPHRVVNIGAGQPVRLLDFIDRIEQELGIEAKRNYMPMQPGDVHRTHASIDLLKELTGFESQIKLEDGVREFVAWYKKHGVAYNG
jgi:UDP-glucuronate 4-epimerase